MSTQSSSTHPLNPTTTSTSTSTSTSSTTTTKTTSGKSAEQNLRDSLQKYRLKLSKREPLHPSYNFLLQQNSYIKPPKTTSTQFQKLYSNFNANLRETTVSYMNKYKTESPANDSRRDMVGRNRAELDESKMKDAFTIRECKEHEQKDLIQASLLAANNRRLPCDIIPGNMVEEGIRKRNIEAMALGLQEKERKRKQKQKDKKVLNLAKQKLIDAEEERLKRKKTKTMDKSELAILEEKLRKTEEQRQYVIEKEVEESQRLRAIDIAKSREREREKERNASDKRERERVRREREAASRRARQMESPQQALHRLYVEPMFMILWDMEFGEEGMNPFRLVIDKINCVDMGVPDYCDVITEPMNLTYIKAKVDNKQYVTLEAFFADVELLINNALLYNSDPNNYYHIAANEMKAKYIELQKKVMLQIEDAKS